MNESFVKAMTIQIRRAEEPELRRIVRGLGAGVPVFAAEVDRLREEVRKRRRFLRRVRVRLWLDDKAVNHLQAARSNAEQPRPLCAPKGAEGRYRLTALPATCKRCLTRANTNPDQEKKR